MMQKRYLMYKGVRTNILVLAAMCHTPHASVVAFNAIGEDPGTLEEVYEPFLIQEGFIKRTPRGREVTPLAYQHLGITPQQLPGYTPGLFD